MGNINEKDLLDEIRFDIREKDLLKARIVLSSLENVSRNTQKQALYEVSQADDKFSIPLLASFLINSPKVAESFPQLRETMFSKILEKPGILLDLLKGAKSSHEKAFLAEVVGDIRLKDSMPILTEMLPKENKPESITKIIISIGMLGDPVAIPLIGKYLYSKNRDVIKSAVQALGDFGSPKAIKLLSERLGENQDLDSIILDVLAKVQIPEALEILNKLLESESAHIRTAVKKRLGEIGNMSLRVLIKNLDRDNPDLVIHTLNVLGDLGDSAAIPAIRKLLFNEPKDANVRFAAYEALGRLPIDKGAFTLAAGLEDPVDNVRNAAAKAIDKNYNPVLAGGVRNIIRAGDVEAAKTITTLIDSQCENIFLDLIEEDFFRTMALQYLSGKAHPDIRLRFADVLHRAGYDDLSKLIIPEKAEKRIGRLKVFAVDDSKMILNVYRTILHNLDCDSQLFEFPIKAIERIKKEKPDIILTDLNMPDITGIDFTKFVRKLYDKEELPIIMVTSQDESNDTEDAYTAGVNGILQKPFTEGHIGKALKQFAGGIIT